MQSKLSLKQALFIVGVMIIVFFSAIKVSGKSVAPTQGVVSAQNVVSMKQMSLLTLTALPISKRAVQAGSGLPIRIKIPKISVDAHIESLGLTPDGTMDSPKSPSNVAWYNLGPRPGNVGSSVIAGHFGWKNNIPAVFDNLSKLKKGDKIYVESATGITTTFVVHEVRTYGEKDDTSSVFISNDEKAHLNLITCEGIYNKTKKSYSGRLVVFANKEIL